MRVLEAVPTELPGKGWVEGVESQRSRVGSTLEWAVFFWPLFLPKERKCMEMGPLSALLLGHRVEKA